MNQKADGTTQGPTLRSYPPHREDGTPYQSFDEFWPYYLQEHMDPANRRLHAIGTTTAMGVVAAALLKGRPAMIPLALVAGYGPAWVGHFFIEKNRPATFTYPRWSLMGDFRMNRLMWTGQLDAELERLGLVAPSADASVDA